jgi:dihydrofolate reductase
MKIILYIAQSLDGYVATEDGSVAWLDPYFSKEFEIDKFIQGIDTVIQGNVTYEQFKTKHPGKNNYVFSSDADTLSEEGVIFVKGNVKDFIESLDKKTHKNVWLIGGPNLITQFLNEGQINEMKIFVMPTLLNNGKSLFQDIKISPKIILKETKSYKNGVVELDYIIK